MKDHQNLSGNGVKSSVAENSCYDRSERHDSKVGETSSKTKTLSVQEKINSEIKKFPLNGAHSQNGNRDSVQDQIETHDFQTPGQISKDLFRLFVKNGEYVYARPNDIIMVESCDHLVKVYVAFGDKMKKTIRHNTLKDFLSQLPAKLFLRIGRFCAVNTDRLSGGNYIEQIFEFDFKITVRLKHPIPQASFGKIGK